ncbi:ABC transporter permease subunit [Limibacillus sp. MBR-115]|uniref:ABC transporter permease n=1 Tax=Limibacillus sp. MBR-115 TaxID=3156465 RepID=UPI00339AE1EF
MLRVVPYLTVALLVGPILAGIAGAFLPAFGWMPTLGGSSLTLEHWAHLFQRPGLWTSVWISLASGLITPAVSLAIVFLFLSGSGGTWLDRWLKRAISPLLSIPHAAAAFGLAFLIAPSGLIVRFLSPWLTGWDRPPDLLIVHDPSGLAMMAGLIAKEIPFLLLMSLAALPQIDSPRRLAVARSLGYGPVTAWLKAVAPGLYPLIRLPIYAVIAFASSTVDVALILGPTNPPTLSVAVVRWLNDPDLSLRFVASAGALLQLLVTFSALLTWHLMERLLGFCARAWYTNGRKGHCDRLLAKAGAGGITLAAFAAFAGLAGLAVSSFAGFWRFPDTLPQAITVKHWVRALPNIEGPFVTALLVGLVATSISLVLVLAALENEVRSNHPAGRRAMRILYLPLIVPQVAFLFGLLIGLEAVGVRPGFWPVAFGHVLFVLPYVYLSLAEAYRQLDPRWIMAARTLGNTPTRAFWTVRLPMLTTPILTAVAIGLAVSIGQYLPTQLLGAGRVPTITTEAVALATGGDRRVIGVWALVQALVPALGFGLALLLPRLVWRHRRQLREVH